MTVEDLMKVKFTGDWERDDALRGVIGGCFSAALASKQMLEYCPSEHAQLTRPMQAARRYGEVCGDTLKAILNWESHDPETLREILENCIFEGELASQELRPYLQHDPDYNEVMIPKNLPVPVRRHVRIGIERCADCFVDCFSYCEDFIRIWIDPEAIW